MAAWSSALDSGAHPAVGYYYEGHTVGVKVVVVQLVASTRLFTSHIIIAVGTRMWGDLGVSAAVAITIRTRRGACVSEGAEYWRRVSLHVAKCFGKKK